MRTFPIAKLGVVLASLLLATVARGQTTYDLTGTWLLLGNDVQQSFCGGPGSQELVVVTANMVQNGESLTISIPGENVLAGRTSNFFVAAEEADNDSSTILTGTVLGGAGLITGTIVFFDKHPCPEAETGQTGFIFIRIG